MCNENISILNDLTIVIPTYNRSSALVRLLKGIETLDYSLLFEILIIDNASNYDVVNILKEKLSHSLFSKCRVVVNRFNVGAQSNINNCFLFSRSKWLWLIGDDDEVEEDSLLIIEEAIKSNLDCAWFKFSTKSAGFIEKDIKIDSLDDFLRYYDKGRADRSKGNLVFMSNNIYNMELLRNYFIYSFQYSYTHVSQILAPLLGLDKKAICVLYSSKSICKFNSPNYEDHWDAVKILLGSATITDIGFEGLSKNQQKKLKEVFTFWTFNGFVIWCLKSNKLEKRIHHVKNVYRRFYKPNVTLIDRLKYLLLIFELKTRCKIFTFVINRFCDKNI